VIDRDEPIRYCRSYNMSGQRCEHPGGHPGDHAIILTWTDEEEWSPDKGGFTPTITQQEYAALEQPFVPTAPPVVVDDEGVPLGPVPIYGASNPGVCLLCNHRMHGGECERGNCDCKAGIPG
jgi:hypothetical protein